MTREEVKKAFNEMKKVTSKEIMWASLDNKSGSEISLFINDKEVELLESLSEDEVNQDISKKVMRYAEEHNANVCFGTFRRIAHFL